MLKDLLRYVGWTVDWEIKDKTYKGRITKVTSSSTNPAIGTYTDLVLVTEGSYHPAMGSAEKENDFSRAHTVRNGKIVNVGAAA